MERKPEQTTDVTRRLKMEDQSTGQNELESQVKAFAQAILESEEYRTFMHCNENLERNQEARNLLLRYQRKQTELQWAGYDAATLDELKDLQMKVKNDETLTKFFSSQAALVDLLKRSNDRISEKIGQTFAQNRRGGCC
ncbi:YlbF family regulator [Methanofollis tationis]|uniref:YlbF family regulator n=1 Tax=Methanofollis tationis TaxID=81417 RepID=A0A7K4HPV0_9EURY|nr:YlbF family regulator [Methanofollis tationis]NVO66878.1 YlbF family regulator [Methanofollis tationis]